jgi:hypothetical protein
MKRQKEDEWQEAKRRCRLNDEEIGMAKELGFQPKSLIKNIPSSSQQWKSPVKEWVRDLYEEKIGRRKRGAAKKPSQSGAPAPAAIPRGVIGEERRNAQDPWPDTPEIADLPPLELDYDHLDEFDDDEPEKEEIDEQDNFMLRRQRLYRWAAQSIAVEVSKVQEVEKVAAFGAVSQPLEREVPRFRQFRRHGIEVLHECADLDLAIWLTDFGRLKELKSAMTRGLATMQRTPFGGAAHHQVDVHLFDAASGDYRGRLCVFNQCPKPGKRECLVPGCGAQLFLRQFQDYRFKAGLFFGEPKVVLFDRASDFRVGPPTVEGQVREVRWKPRSQEDDDDIDGAVLTPEKTSAGMSAGGRA